MQEGDGTAVAIVLVGLYLFPTLIAWLRKNRQLPAIAVLNVLLGWTLIGWAAALVWAVIRPAGPAR